MSMSTRIWLSTKVNVNQDQCQCQPRSMSTRVWMSHLMKSRRKGVKTSYKLNADQLATPLVAVVWTVCDLLLLLLRLFVELSPCVKETGSLAAIASTTFCDIFLILTLVVKLPPCVSSASLTPPLVVWSAACVEERGSLPLHRDSIALSSKHSCQIVVVVVE